MSKKLTEKEKLGFEALLQSMMTKRMIISSVVLLTFLSLISGIAIAISYNTSISEQWKELLLLLLGAFIGSYGKIIDYWFTDTDKDKLLVQKMDEEDGVAISSVDITNKSTTPTPDNDTNQKKTGVEVDEDGDGTMDGLDYDNDGKIDEYFPHRYCEHVWGDEDKDGQEECLICGLIKEK